MVMVVVMTTVMEVAMKAMAEEAMVVVTEVDMEMVAMEVEVWAFQKNLVSETLNRKLAAFQFTRQRGILPPEVFLSSKQ